MRENKFDIGDKVLLDYGKQFGIVSVVTDWRYSPKTGYSYELKKRPGRYWKENRLEEVDDELED